MNKSITLIASIFILGCTNNSKNIINSKNNTLTDISLSEDSLRIYGENYTIFKSEYFSNNKNYFSPEIEDVNKVIKFLTVDYKYLQFSGGYNKHDEKIIFGAIIPENDFKIEDIKESRGYKRLSSEKNHSTLKYYINSEEWTEYIESIKNDYPELIRRYLMYKTTGQVNLEGESDFDHEEMAINYFGVIIQALKEYDNSLTLEQYNVLAWVGLHNTIAYQNFIDELEALPTLDTDLDINNLNMNINLPELDLWNTLNDLRENYQNECEN